MFKTLPQILNYHIFCVSNPFVLQYIYPHSNDSGQFIYPQYHQNIHYIFYSIITMCLIIVALIATISDPTDTFLIMQCQYRLVNKQFNYMEFQLDLFCDLCEGYVQKHSKHCKRCNRCTENFDHHCKWINNCIGGINYKYFIALIFLLSSFLIYALVLQIIFFCDYSVNYSSLTENNLEKSIIIFNDQFDLQIKLGLSIFFFVVQLCGGFAVIQLLIFHAYLITKNISTYEYILEQRKIQAQSKNMTKQRQITPEVPRTTFQIVNDSNSIDKKYQESNNFQLIEFQQKLQKKVTQDQEKDGQDNLTNYENDKIKRTPQSLPFQISDKNFYQINNQKQKLSIPHQDVVVVEQEKNNSDTNKEEHPIKDIQTHNFEED